jgi:hypothetical protein
MHEKRGAVLPARLARLYASACVSPTFGAELAALDCFRAFTGACTPHQMSTSIMLSNGVMVFGL